MKLIRAGELREKITFQDQVRVSDGTGGGSYTPSDILNTFAKVQEVSSNLSDVALKDDVKQLVKFTIRYRTDVYIQNGNTITWRGFSYQVHNFLVDPLRTRIEILAFQVMNTTKRGSEIPVIVDTFDLTFDTTFG